MRRRVNSWPGFLKQMTPKVGQLFVQFHRHWIFHTAVVTNHYPLGFRCSGLLKLDTQLSGNLPLERSVHYEEKTHV